MFAVFKEIIFSGIYLLVIYLKKTPTTNKIKSKRTQINTPERWCLGV